MPNRINVKCLMATRAGVVLLRLLYWMLMWMPCLLLLGDGEGPILLREDEEERMGPDPGRDRIPDHIIGFELGPYLEMPTP